MRALVLAACGLTAAASRNQTPNVHELPAEQRRPRYAKVGADIETLWQRPRIEPPKGVLFMAHGCQHQATDFFSEVGSDGFRLQECKTSNFGRCLGLPAERQAVTMARHRGYLVMAVSGGRGFQSCWDMSRDPDRVVQAVQYVLKTESLPAETPVLAMGASSGGAFVGLLPRTALAPQLRCISPQIMGIAVPSVVSDRTAHSLDTALWRRAVPTLFVHMPRDRRTMDRVSNNIKVLRGFGIATAEIRVEPSPVTPVLLERAMPRQNGEAVVAALAQAGLIDDHGYLVEDPRAMWSLWSRTIRAAAPAGDSLKPDESPLAELLNVAWAMHEFVPQYTNETLDFCESKTPGKTHEL